MRNCFFSNRRIICTNRNQKHSKYFHLLKVHIYGSRTALRRKKMINLPLLLHFKNSTSVITVKLAFSKSIWRAIRYLALILFLTSLLLYWIRQADESAERTKLILITPTHRRTERLADLTRLSQTLMHVKDDLHWILVEDGQSRSAAVEALLKRSAIAHTYLVHSTEPGFPGRGWPQRNIALDHVRRNFARYGQNAVVYFADDDNSYDLRLFRHLLPKVRTIGFWAVGLVRHAYIEAPLVRKSRIVGWQTWNAPANVEFPIDMAGFGINLALIRKHNASFHRKCSQAYPEDCFLRQFGLHPSECQPFVVGKDVLVWHTKTYSLGTNGSTFGYLVTD